MKKDKKIIIVDYGVGNLYNVTKAFNFFGADCVVSEESSDINSADALVLPGVGSFGSGMKGLEVRELAESVKDFANSGRPILGICLGAQLLLSKGYEFGEFDGLDIIKGEIVKFPIKKKSVKIPHIGWNKIYPIPENSWDGSILADIKSGSSMYFVHSYILQPENKEDAFAVSEYEDYKFCSAVKKGNVYGVQFHPEKSGEVGLKIIKNFINTI